MNRLRAAIEALAGARWPLRALAPLSWAGLIFWLSSRPASPKPSFAAQPLLHNFGHVVVYAVLAALVAVGFGRTPRRGAALVAWCLATLYGASDEYHQSLVPGRVASFGDLAADACGAALGLAVLLWIWCGSRAAQRLALWLVPVALLVVALETWA